MLRVLNRSASRGYRECLLYRQILKFLWKSKNTVLTRDLYYSPPCARRYSLMLSPHPLLGRKNFLFPIMLPKLLLLLLRNTALAVGDTCYTLHGMAQYSSWLRSAHLRFDSRKGHVFDLHRAEHLNIISIAKPTRCTNVPNLFYFRMTLYMFRSVFPSITRSSRMYIEQQAFVKEILLSASKQTAVSV